MKFSQRHGYTEVRTVAQIEEIDEPLRTALWNITYLLVFNNSETLDRGVQMSVRKALWVQHFGRPLDAFEYYGSAEPLVRETFFKGEWHAVYDAVEFLATRKWTLADVYASQVNDFLEAHNAGYRILSGEVVPISSTTELEEIATAITSTGPGSGAAMHLNKAMGFLADRENPDYANSVKESISAVESVAREMTDAMTLGAALNALARSEVDLHPAQIEAWRAMYKVANDTPGVRHGGSGEPAIDLALARYFLIASSAFVNLLLARK